MELCCLAPLHEKVMDIVFKLYQAPINNVWLVTDGFLPNMAASIYISSHVILWCGVDPPSRGGVYIHASSIWGYFSDWLDLQSVAEVTLRDLIGSAIKAYLLVCLWLSLFTETLALGTQPQCCKEAHVITCRRAKFGCSDWQPKRQLLCTWL